MHIAARIEDAYTAFRGRIARLSGKLPTVVAFRGYGSTQSVRILARVLYIHPDPTTHKVRKYVRGWRAFLGVPVAHTKVKVKIGDKKFTVRSDRGGVIDEGLPISLPVGSHTVLLRVNKGTGWASSDVRIVDSRARVGIVCDIDDTVMVTALPRLLLAAWNTFVLDEHARRPVPGMAVFLTKLADRYPDAPVVYLSTGPWNVATTLERFLSRHMFPRGPLLLTDWGATPERFFRSGREHKVKSLDRLVAKFPNIKWVLIGDDGQHDETTYGDFARRHPDNVLGVGIRRLSGPEAVLAGAPISHPDPVPGLTWVYGHNGADLAERFSAAGLMDGPKPEI
jgi:phosphatidate phosphatase APP1